MKSRLAPRSSLSLHRSLWLYALQQKSPAPVSSAGWRCPKCAVVMRSVALPRVTVEICPQCRGVFLDDGELEKLA